MSNETQNKHMRYEDRIEIQECLNKSRFMRYSRSRQAYEKVSKKSNNCGKIEITQGDDFLREEENENQ